MKKNKKQQKTVKENYLPSIGDFLPYSSHINNFIIKNTDGSYLMGFKFSGLAYDGKQNTTLNNYLRQFDSFIKQGLKRPYRSNIFIEVYTINKKEDGKRAVENILIQGNNDFTLDLNHEHIKSFSESTTTTFYLMITYRPYKTIAGMKAVHNLSGIRKLETKANKELSEIASLINSYFNDYNPQRLEKKGNQSELINFISELLFNKFNPNLMQATISSYISNSTIYSGSSDIFITENEIAEKKYHCILSFNEYPATTTANLLHPLLATDIEFILFSRFMPIDKQEALSLLKKQFNQQERGDDASSKDLEDLSIAIDEIASDDFVLGNYHLNALLSDNDIETLRNNISLVLSIVSSAGFNAKPIKQAKITSYFSLFPSNHTYSIREAKIGSGNAVAISPMFSSYLGKKTKNPWGNALSAFKSKGKIAYFNFHSTKLSNDNEHELVAGNSLIIGSTGSGKTVLQNFLLASHKKYEDSRIYLFDLDMGGYGTIKALGGDFLNIKLGEPSGFNPFAMPNNEETIVFLQELLESIYIVEGVQLDVEQRQNINKAIIATLNQSSVETKNLSGFKNYLQPNSISYQAIASWCRGGRNGWIFDNEYDSFKLSDVMGFEMSNFIDLGIRSPILIYIFFRIRQSLKGRSKTIISIDEAWKPLQDEKFAEFIEQEERTIRKKNGLLLFSSQSPEEFINNKKIQTFLTHIQTKILLANPTANYSDYVFFGLTKEEFLKVKNLGLHSREFLVKTQDNSYIAKFDAPKKYIDILSTNSEKARRIDSAIVSAENKDWWNFIN